MTVITDLAHPDFPHGQSKGYRRGCRASFPCPATPTCADVRRKEAKLSAARRAGLLPPTANTRVDGAPVQAHMRKLLAQPGVTLSMLATVSGVERTTLDLLGRRDRVRLDTARRLLNITPQNLATLAPLSAQVPVTEKDRQLVRSLHAQGFSMNELGRRLGCTGDWLGVMANGRCLKMRRDLQVRLHRLAVSMEREHGCDEGARHRARKRGWYPLTAYDDDGNLIPDAVRTAATDRADEYAERRQVRADRIIRALEMSLQGKGARSIADELELSSRHVLRYRQRAGLQFELDLAGGEARLGMVRPTPASRERARHLQSVFMQYRAVYPAVDPVDLLVREGIWTQGEASATAEQEAAA